jgi:alpha-tubulin suppressor-like RCC1 family protein
MTAAGFFTPAPATPTSPPLVVTDPAPEPGAITIVPADKNEVRVLQQLQLNAPGYPMFKGSSAAFMGDYIDVQGQNFVMTPKGWAFNMGATLAPVFHAVWTSNQDVKAPPYSLVDNKPDWKLYTPVTLWIAGSRPGFPASSPLQKGMLFDGGRTSPNISNPNISNTAPIAVCDPATTGSRDQNIYTARITEGLQVSTPQNAKFLNGQVPVGFVIAAANSTSKPMTVTFGAPTGVANGNFSYTTDFAAAVTSVTDVQIAPYSSVYRTLFVRQGTSLNSAPTILVTVSETGCSACRAGSLTFNPPVALSSLVAPDGATAPGTAGELYAATIGAPNISNPNISNPNISNPNISNPNISNPNISNPNISNPNISNPNISNPNISNPNISNPNISNPNISNPNISNPNISNSAVSDANYTFTNSGNTTTSYFVKVVGDISKAPKPLQLIVSKTYKTPSAVGCDLKEVAHDQLVVSVPDVSGAIVDPNTAVSTGVSSPNISNATLSLAPGESATVTLRGFNIPLAEMAKVASSFTPAPVPAAVPPSNTVTYQNWGSPGSGTGSKPFVKTATSTSLAIVNGAYVATVTPAAGVTGTVSFIVGAQVLKVAPVVSGAAGFTPATPLAPADVMVAYFSGDATYAASSSNAVSGLAAAKIKINAPISGVDGLVTVSDATGAPLAGAFVQVDQTFDTVPHSYSGLTGVGGFFSLPSHPTDPWPAGSTVTVTVTHGNSLVTSQGILPGVASIASPQAGANVPVDQDIAVSWTGTFPAPSTQFYLGAWYGNGLSAATARIADVSTMSFPANSFPAGQHLDLSVYSLHMPLVTGDVAPGSVLELYAFSVTRTVNTIPTAVTVPGAPTAVGAMAGTLSASLSWTAPASNGGSAITAYSVFSSPAAPAGATVSVNVAAATASISGLSNQAYTFTVAATNAVGTGPESLPSNQVTPAAPLAVTIGISPGPGTLLTNLPYTFTATVGNTTDPVVIWSVTTSTGAATTGASITAGGVFVATSPGSYTVTATAHADGSKSASASVTATAPVVVTVGVSPSNVPLLVGQVQAFTATVSPAGTAVTWSVSPAMGATIDPVTGVFSSTLAGNYTVQATTVTPSPVSSTATVTVGPVRVPVAQSTMGSSGLELSIGGAGNQKVAQVVAGYPGNLVGVRFPVDCRSADQLTVQIQEVTAGVPNGVVRAQKVISNAGSLLPGPFTQLDQFSPIYFDAPVPASSDFAVVFSAGLANCGILQGPTGDAYPGGDSYFFNDYTAGAWRSYVVLGTNDFAFRILSTSPVVGVSPGSIALLVNTPQTFVAAIDGAVSTAVTWSVTPTSGATIGSATGVFSATSAGSYTVTATSTADSLAFNTASVTVTAPPPFVAPAQAASAIAASRSSSYSIRAVDSVPMAWGMNEYGALGTNVALGALRPVPTAIGMPLGARSISARTYHALAVDVSGSLWAWGFGYAIGQVPLNNPVPISYGTLGTGTQTITAISAGFQHGLAVRSDGLVFGFGDASTGALGPVNASIAVRNIAGLSGIVAVAAGDQHGLALASDGTVWSFGSNQHGQLGDGTNNPRYTPQPIAGLGQVVAIAAGAFHSVALRSDGTVWTWGYGGYGNLGNGALLNSSVPVQVSGLTTAQAITAGANHTLALLANGTIRSWGLNEYGELGDSSVTNSPVPVDVVLLSNIVEVSAGESHSLARRSDGTVWAWGLNNTGQLGTAVQSGVVGAHSPVPVQVGAVTVTVTPASIPLGVNQTYTFAAVVAGAFDPGVTWSVEAGGGVIGASSGFYTAPATAGTYHVYATSNADPTKVGTAIVTVSPATALLAVTVTPSPSGFADPVTVTVAFTAAPGSPMPNGTVTVSDLPRTTTPGAMGFAAVSGPIACSPSPSSAWICSASFALPAYPWWIAGTHTLTATYAGDPNHSLGSSTVDTFVDIPVPSLVAAGLSSRPAGGIDYFLRLDNWYEYADEAFQAQAGPPCGSSPSSSRTWVDILDGTTGAFIYGYCAFGSQSDLKRFSFFVGAGATPPASLKVRVTDYVRNVTFDSNVVPLPTPITVSIAPATVTIRTGWTQGFVETVKGTTYTWVDWTTSGGGTVDWYGNFTATTPGTYVVTATSDADPSASGSATVTVIDGAPPFVGTVTATRQVWLSRGQSFTITAKVTWTGPASPPPTGKVGFYLAPNATRLGWGTNLYPCGPNAVCADLVLPAAALGIASPTAPSQSYTIWSSYDGDAYYASSWDLGMSLTVARPGTWIPRANYSCLYQPGVAAAGGKIFAFCRYDLSEYDPAIDTWTARGAMPEASSSAGVASANGKIYSFRAAGGVATTMVYDPGTGAAAALPPMPTPRNDAAAVALPDGRILVIGGYDVAAGSNTGVVEIFDAATETWVGAAAQASVLRQGANAAYSNGKVYVVGGDNFPMSGLSAVEVYDVATNSWSPGPPLTYGRDSFGLVVAKGMLYAIAGWSSVTGAPTEGSVEVLDTSNPAAWTAGTGIRTPRSGAAAVTPDGGTTIYLVGGLAQDSTNLPIEAFLTP